MPPICNININALLAGAKCSYVIYEYMIRRYLKSILNARMTPALACIAILRWF